MTFKEYVEWLFEYTDRIGSWTDYDCEYGGLPEDEVQKRYMLYKFMLFCMKHSKHSFNDLYDDINDIFLTEAIIVRYKEKKYLITEYNGQGTANNIEPISHHCYDCYGFIDVDELIAAGLNWGE